MNYIRDIYKKDYRGFEMLPARRTGVKEKYSVKSQRTILKDYLLEDFQKKCIYCGWDCNRYDSASFHIEHIISQHQDSALIDDYNNLALSCPICNTSKNKNSLPDNLDPLSSDFSDLFYRNRRGAIVVNNQLDDDKKELSQQYINTIGLAKELYKLDYIYASLNKLKRDPSLTKYNDLFRKINEILDFIDENYSRSSRLTLVPDY